MRHERLNGCKNEFSRDNPDVNKLMSKHPSKRPYHNYQ